MLNGISYSPTLHSSITSTTSLIDDKDEESNEYDNLKDI